MVHKEFQSAGKKPGLQVWRVEKMDLAPVPSKLYGDFYTGDAYIILYTTPAPSYNVHSWIGDEATKDESGAAAIFITQLDGHLGGGCSAIQRSSKTKSHSPFRVTSSLGIKVQERWSRLRLQACCDQRHECEAPCLHVKGRRTVRATEVLLSWGSFNKGDCFIIGLGKEIYHWSGSESNRYERLKTHFKMGQRPSRCNEEEMAALKVNMIDEGAEPRGCHQKNLDQKPSSPLQEDCDVTIERTKKNKGSLYLISDAAGQMSTTLVASSNPFKQDMLSPSECLHLGQWRRYNIFVWKGPKANPGERKEALTVAQKFIKEKNYSPRTKVQIIPAGSETTLFKQFFFKWLEGEATGQTYTVGRIAKVEKIPFDASELHGNNAMAAQYGMVDDGSGKVQIWRVEGGDKAPVDPSSYGHFYGGDCYLVLYSYFFGGRQKHIIYTWQGQKCSQDELAASAFLTVRLDDSMGGVATQVRVTQSREPPHLVSLFKDKPLIIHLGGTSRKGEDKQNLPALGSSISARAPPKHCELLRWKPLASSLNTNDVFVLKSANSLFVWKGKGASPDEMTAAQYVASLLGGTTTEVDESKEPAGFWSALGGKKEYQTSRTLQNIIRPPRLFGCSNKTGRLIAEEVPGDFSQIDLATDDVMVLDTWDQVFVWIGNEANETEKTGAPKIAQEYVNSDPSGRRGIPITTIKQGQEPPSFTGWFHGWDPKMWN
uniref:Gelsolin n=1 Tax=Anableps anableps TaxID=195821 RepID=Q800R0_ANAAN|nr:gelsolin [Anableps anableps]